MTRMTLKDLGRYRDIGPTSTCAERPESFKQPKPAPWVPPGEGVMTVPGARGYTMSIPEVCVRLAVLPTRLAQWRKLGVGPSYARPGGHPNSPIFYRPSEIEAVRKDMLDHREAEPRAEVAARIKSTTPPKPRAKRKK